MWVFVQVGAVLFSLVWLAAVVKVFLLDGSIAQPATGVSVGGGGLPSPQRSRGPGQSHWFLPIRHLLVAPRTCV